MLRKSTFLIGMLAVSPALVAFSVPSRAAAQQSGERWWVWVLIILVVLLELWWCLRHCLKRKAGAAPEAEVAAPPRAVEAPGLDDLQRIEGIGPKISGLLQSASITTFAQLANADVDRLRQIVREAGITIANPDTWPEQAGLAAAGRWEELEVLQEELKGGRRV